MASNTLHTRFTADDSGLRGALSNARQGLLGMGSGISGINRLASGIILADVIRRSVRAMREFIGSSIDAAASISVLRTQIGLMEKSADAGYEVVDMIKEFSLQTSQSIDEIGKLYAGMRAFTDTRAQAEGMVEAMLDLSAVFPGLTANMSKASYNIGQLARGIGTSIDIREFARSGMNFNAVLEQMSENTGMVVEDYKQYKAALEAGLLTTDDFYNAIFSYADEFEGSAEAMVKNWKGFTQVLANTKAVISDELLGKSLDLFGRFGSQALAQFRERWLDSGKIADMGKEFAMAVEAGIQGAIAAFDIDFKLFPDDDSQLFGDGMEVSDHPAFQMMENLKGAIDEYGGFIIEYFKTLGGAMLGMKAASTVLGLIASPMLLLGALLLGGIGILAAYKTETFGVKEALNSLYNEGILMLNNGLLLLTGFITGIKEAFMEWWNSGSMLTMTLQNIWEIIQNVSQAIGVILTPIIQTIGKNIKTFVIPTFQTWWSVIKTVIGVVAALANLVGQALNLVFRVLAGILNNFVAPAFRVVWTIIKTLLSPIVEKVTGIFKGFKGALDAVISVVRGLIDWINKLAAKLASIKLPKALQPGSPTPFELGLRGINDEMKRANSLMQNSAFNDLGNGGLKTGINQNAITINVNGAGDPDAVAAAISRKLAGELRLQGMSHAHI